MDITREKYEYALNRIEELLPLMERGELSTSEDSELAIMSDIVEAYEAEHYALDTLSVGEMIRYALDECGKSQAELARELNLSASRISDFVNDRSEPSLRVAGELCRLLDISPQMMLGV